MRIPINFGRHDCLLDYCGLWSMEPMRFRQAVTNITKQGRLDSSDELAFATADSSIGELRLVGPLMKGYSKFGGTSTVAARGKIREIARNDAIRTVAMLVDSPGGTVAGTESLADDIAQLNAIKPVHAFIEDLGASAAYWAVSQAKTITANRTAEVGAIGVYGVIQDESKAAADMGIVVHVVKSRRYKGVGEPGAAITDEQLAYVQGLVDAQDALMVEAIARGRKMSVKAVDATADGRVLMAKDAKEAGLIDAIDTFENWYAGLSRKMTRAAARSRALTLTEIG